MAGTNKGRIDWGLQRDEEGHRTYNISFEVKTSASTDGPLTVLQTAGLPLPGAAWAYGGDSDPWAFCYPTAKVRPRYTPEEPHTLWIAEFTFSTKPLRRCQDTSIENPLDEPPKLSGSFTKFTKQVQYDRNGDLIESSSHEPLTGPETEFDDNRPSVRISMNEPNLPLAQIADFVDKVNDSTLWGLGARKIKLSNVSWTRQLYGTCNFYFTIDYEFDVNFLTFDKTAADRGFLKLSAGGNQANLGDFEMILDEKGNPIKSPKFLDGNGNVAATVAAAGAVQIEYYDERNMLALGIPASLV